MAAYPAPIRDHLLRLRTMVYDIAEADPEIGEVYEALKWGQPSFLTRRPQSGTTLRIDRAKKAGDHHIALYFSCQSTLGPEIQSRFGHEIECDGKRQVLLDIRKSYPDAILAEIIGLTLKYQIHKREQRV